MGRHYVLVCGSHERVDVEAVHEVVDALHLLYGEELRLMHGAARCVDQVAGVRAKQLGVPVREFPADWTTHGKRAGPIRNEAMAEYLAWCRDLGHTTQVVAFRGGNGTEDMIRRAEARGFDVDRIEA